MKKKLYILIGCLASIVSLSSCSDWFDVSPNTDIKASELFETESGFQNALAGIYISMTDAECYGNNLSFGMLDQLAQLYDMIPSGTSSEEDIYNYTTTDTGYNTKSRLSDTWSKAYSVIANVNNLLKWLDQNGERILGGETLSMMYGEAYAIRACLHFDLLRCWGPMSYATEADTKCIPYRVVADNSKQPLLAASKIVENILADLQLAEQYLSFEKGVSLSNNNRRFRLNYYAVKALEARVYNYSGDATNAFNCADEVISGCGLELQTENQDDPILFDETLFAVNKYKMDEELDDYFTEGPTFTEQYYFTLDKYRTLFEASGNSSDVDIRAKSGAILTYSSSSRAISRKYIKNDNAAIPIIRLPEMYYIKCESAALANAPQYINAVRSKRGFTVSAAYQSFANETERTSALNLEYRKEFYAEGQYFYFLKRHGYTTVNYTTVTFNKDRYVFPLPDREKEYGWTSENDTENE